MNERTTIYELNELEDIEHQETEFYNKHGYEIFRLSTWNPSSYFIDKYLKNKLSFMPIDMYNYNYTYDLPAWTLEKVKLQLGIPEHYKCIITNSGTTSIDLVTAFLQDYGVSRLLVISPTYFTVFYQCRQHQIKITEVYLKHKNGSFTLPQAEILKNISESDAVWITNPVYNAGLPYKDEDIKFFCDQILSRCWLIADECFCQSGFEMIRKLSNVKHFIGIYDPLKQIAVNGMKFSVIAFPAYLESFFNHWSDIVGGNLPDSSLQAIQLYNSPTFSEITREIIRGQAQLQDRVERSLVRCSNIHMDKSASGHMRMIYVPTLPSSFLNRLEQQRLFEATATSIIPGTRFHFPAEDGFCFRVNLSRESPLFIASLERVFDYLLDSF